MVEAGVNPKVAKKSYKKAYRYFDSLRKDNVNNPYFDI
ncbi:hypothetical protein SAMN02745664_12116 [Moraxella cuniculi DSM 21768]|uniref:Uncharacterized protein n=1 Tax=Moraxella cuniculi DSM 21768 TaxID=1122245 RepID=A0A1N7G158_9GAMM|nr:hypothetical protein SAMN02745664_12116 [Moraxella cuniculi DSM 21768]